MKFWKLISGSIALCLSTSGFAAKLNVPEDFPNSFYMDLLSGSVIVDYESGLAAPGQLEVIPTGGVSQILFDATEFYGGVDASSGTSDLTLTSNNTVLASFLFGGITGSFYLDGTGMGTLVDNGNGSGEWSMDIPLYAEWGGNTFNFSDLILSTSTSHTYNTAVYDIFGDIVGDTTQVISGISMDYETGDAFLVGQSTLVEQGHPFNGMRITLGMYGNDPVFVSAVPVPSAVWLFGSGLIGLVGFARRKKA